MPRVTVGDIAVKPRAKRVLKAIVAFANEELEGCEHVDLKCAWQQELKPPELVVQTTLRALVELCQKDGNEGKLSKPQIREALKRMEDFLHILKDNRAVKKGLEDWHFTLTLWSKRTDENLTQFEQAWENHRPTKSKEQSAGGQTVLPEPAVKQQPLSKLSKVPELPLKYLLRSDTLRQLKSLVLAEGNQTVVVTGGTGKAKASRKVGIQGMGGIGKSVLAAALAHDEGIQRAFPDGIVWVTLGQTPALPVRQTQVARAFLQNQPTFEDMQMGKAFLSQLLADKSCLLVLDDVWQLDHATAFNVLGSASQLLITTRKAELITALGAQPYQVELLDEAEALQLLAKSAEQDMTTLPKDAKAIVRECGRLPLAVAMVGAMARGNPNRWGSLLRRLQQADLDKIKQQFPDYPYSDLLRAIQVSVDDLEPEPKQRYLDLAVFPEDIPVSPAALQTFWQGEGMDELEIEETIEIFVNRSLLQRDEQSFLRLHDLQRDYLGKQVEQDLPILHNRLLDTYAAGCPNGWASGANDGYFFENLAYHLKQAGREQELWQLLTESPAWMEAKFIACTGDSAYVADIELALVDFVDPLPLEQLLNLVQLHTARQVVHQRVGYYRDDDLTTLVWLNREAEALNHARLRTESFERFQGLLTIYKALKNRGEPPFQLLGEALDLVLSMRSSWKRSEALIEITKALISVNQLDRAIEAAQSIEENERRSEALSEVARTLSEASQFKAALTVLSEVVEVVQSIGDSWRRAYRLVEATRALAAINQFDKALEVARLIEDGWSRAEALREVANALITTGQFGRASQILTEALEVAQLIEEDERRIEVLINIAKTLAKAGQLNVALEMARSIQVTLKRAYALSDIAESIASIGQPDAASTVLIEALNVARSIEDRSYEEGERRTFALIRVAKALITIRQFNEALVVLRSAPYRGASAPALGEAAGALAEAVQLDAALEVVGLIRDSGGEAAALSKIVEALVSIYQPDAALKVAQLIEYDKSQAEALIRTAEAMRAIGQFDSAKVVLIKAWERVRLIEHSESRIELLSKIAKTLGSIGQLDAALEILTESLEVARSIEHPWVQVPALRQIARSLAKADELNAALEVAQLIEDSKERAEALVKISEVLIEIGQLDAASGILTQSLEVARLTEHIRVQISTLGLFAIALTETGQLDVALEVAQLMKDYGGQTGVLIRIAKSLAFVGQRDTASQILIDALAVPQSINYSGKRIETQRKITKALAIGQIDTALETARSIESGWDRVKVLSEMIEAMANTGQLNAVSQILTEALVIARLESGVWQIRSLREIAEVMAVVGQLDTASQILTEALVAIQSIDYSESRIEELAEIARILPIVGQLDVALAVTQSIEHSDKQTETQKNIVKALVKTSQLDAALAVAESIKDNWKQKGALRDVAKALAVSDQIDKALEVVQSMRSRGEEAEMPGEVADSLARSHCFIQALKNIGLRETSEFLFFLVKWEIPLDQAKPSLSFQVLREVIRIAGWVHPQWQKIYELLHSTSSGCSIT